MSDKEKNNWIFTIFSNWSCCKFIRTQNPIKNICRPRLPVSRRQIYSTCNRILDLGGELKQEAAPEAPVFTDIVEFIEHDYNVSVEGIAYLNEVMESGILDTTTYDLMKVYLKDEEEDMYWSEQQLDLCKMIGKQNYLTQLLINDQNGN